MQTWQRTTLLLCAFGLFKEFRPSEPFFTEYLIDFKNVSQDFLVHVAFPISTYTYLGTLAVVFLVTDFLRYKSVVIVEGLAYVATWILLPWGKGETAIIFVEICYGIACSTEVAYYTYIYAKVDREHYQKVTSYTYSAIFAGRFLGGVFAQVLVSLDLMDYHELNYISLGCVSIALTCSLLLPPVKKSIYFHRDEQANNQMDHHVAAPISFVEKVKKTRNYLFLDLKDAYSNSHVVKWSLWWAVATSGHLIVVNFVQSLWETIVNSSENEDFDSQRYNGAVEAIHTLLSAILAFGVGHIKIPWSKWGESFLSIVSLAQGGLLILSSQTNNLYVAYVSYILYRIMYQVVITIASAEVAQRIREDSYGLIFGINTFLALAIQTILTLVVADEVGYALDERKQFLVYGFYHATLGVVFLGVAILILFKCIRVPKDIPLTESETIINNYGATTVNNNEDNIVKNIVEGKDA